jgi:ATP/maltotriose-dependent transcriptional regulator MalT
MALEKGGRDSTIDVLSLMSRNIEAYLRDEVIASWSDEKKDFALKTCILETLSGSLVRCRHRRQKRKKHVAADQRGKWIPRVA